MAKFLGIFDPPPHPAPSWTLLLNKAYVINGHLANPLPLKLSMWFMDDPKELFEDLGEVLLLKSIWRIGFKSYFDSVLYQRSYHHTYTRVIHKTYGHFV